MVPTARPCGRDTSWRSGRWRAAWSTASIFSTVSSSKADSPYVKRRDRASGDEPPRCDPAFGLPCVDAKGDERWLAPEPPHAVACSSAGVL